MSATATKVQIPAQVADRLLELLATDDGFRELFARDRHAALVQVGLAPELVKVSPLDCMVVERLAGKDEIAAARDELVAYLTAGGNHNNPHVLEAGRMSAVLRQR
ncbi:putative modified peptide [Kribbella sandramycini]|uniref:Putative modified peptide n=1 Tax=Kribbella sandramycini TaxID=60450 RepID=A0A7Y4NYN4_9ACTN|nr:NHLP-related RiPP peptide [Kribbella sandramycini]MBB6569009.1 putative modified peptide [Kribbella sandramycini]NOL41147.1 putative modified peptide [Kribbella sandramycini]